MHKAGHEGDGTRQEKRIEEVAPERIGPAQKRQEGEIEFPGDRSVECRTWIGEELLRAECVRALQEIEIIGDVREAKARRRENEAKKGRRREEQPSRDSLCPGGELADRKSVV